MREITNVIDFWAATARPKVVFEIAKREGCVPCRRLAPQLEAMSKHPDFEDIEFAVLYLDEVDKDTFDYFVGNLNVMGTPTLLAYNYGGLYKELLGRTAAEIAKELWPRDE